jgi:hypothetical protein
LILLASTWWRYHVHDVRKRDIVEISVTSVRSLPINMSLQLGVDDLNHMAKGVVASACHVARISPGRLAVHRSSRS